MKKNRSSHGLATCMVRILGAFSLFLAAFDANADGGCWALYARSSATPGTPTCRLDVVSTAPGGMGDYACLNDIESIDAWCASSAKPDLDSPEPDLSCPVADPVYPGSGAVTLTVADFVSGDDLPMLFTRTYNSKRIAKNGGPMGAGWFHSWQRHLELANANDGSAPKVVAYRENGEPVTFNWSAGSWRTPGFTGLALSQNASGWALTDLQTETVESYSVRGVLLSEETKTRITRTLAYDASGLLSTISQHAVGTMESMDVTLRLDYDDQRRLSSQTDPLGHVTRYGYDTNNNLISVTWPDGSVYRYAYEDSRFPNALTGEVNEVGTRIATWTYDEKGRATTASHPDATRNVQFTYNAGSTVVAGSKRTTTINISSIGGMLRPTASMSTEGNAISAWDVSGKLVKDTDASGGTSEYSYDAAGRPVKSIIKNRSGTSVSTIRYADATSLRPSMIASPNLIQSFVYDFAGNATGISEMPTSDPTGASGFAALKADGLATMAYGMTYDSMNRISYVLQTSDGKWTGQWGVIRDYTGNVYGITQHGKTLYNTKMMMRDAAHRVVHGRNPSGEFDIEYDLRGRISAFKFKEFASSENGGVRRLFKVAFGFSPDGRVTSRTGTVATNGSATDLSDGPAIPISDEEINQWIDNYNYGDSPVGPLAIVLRARALSGGPSFLASTVCNDCHFSAGLGGAARGIAFVWKLIKNPALKHGIGQGARKAAQAWERVKQMCKPAAETEVDGIPPGRITSEYTNKTIGRSTRNIETDVPRAEFEANLRNNGWAHTLSKDGKADIFTKNGARYVVRNKSNAGMPTADFYPAGAPGYTLKIRLPKP
ncbi:DUF6531 domain-containing protein [Burkholderia sp. AW49-1]